jgi:hypothetical protein
MGRLSSGGMQRNALQERNTNTGDKAHTLLGLEWLVHLPPNVLLYNRCSPYFHAAPNFVKSCQPSSTPTSYLSRLTSARGFYGGKIRVCKYFD